VGCPCGQQIVTTANCPKSKQGEKKVPLIRWETTGIIRYPVDDRCSFFRCRARQVRRRKEARSRSLLANLVSDSAISVRNCWKHQQEWCGLWTAVKFFSSELTGFYQDGDESCHRSDVAGEPSPQLGHSHMVWHAERIQRKSSRRGREGSWEHLYQGWLVFFFLFLFGFCSVPLFLMNPEPRVWRFFNITGLLFYTISDLALDLTGCTERADVLYSTWYGEMEIGMSKIVSFICSTSSKCRRD
jgi:hypothetical protein